MGADHGVEAQAGNGEIRVLAGEGIQPLLHGSLVFAVGKARLGTAGLGFGDAGGVVGPGPIGGDTAGIDHLAHARLPGGAEEILAAADIDGAHEGAVVALTAQRLGENDEGQVDDHVCALQVAREIRVADVGLDRGETGMAEDGRVAVEGDDLINIGVRQQCRKEGAGGMPGGAGDEDAHGFRRRRPCSRAAPAGLPGRAGAGSAG